MPDPTPTVSDAKELLRAGTALGGVIDRNGFNPAVIVPEGFKLEELTPRDELPSHIKAKPSFVDAASFCAYFAAFKTGDVRIFADQDKSTVQAIFDYHFNEGDPGPGHGEHIAYLNVRPSPEWKVWFGANKRAMDQEAFAEFLETSASDVTKPSAAEFLEIALNLSVNKSVRFQSTKRLADGARQFQFVEDVNGVAGKKGELAIPEVFSLALAPYQGLSRYGVDARLRYRIDGSGKLSLWYELIRADEIQRDAFQGVLKAIADETKQTILMGSP